MKVKSEPLLDAVDIAGSQGAYGIAITPADDGWETWSMGQSRISMVFAKLPSEAFPDGYVKGEEFTVRNDFFPDAVRRGTEPDITVEDGRITVTDGKRKQWARLSGADTDGIARAMPAYSPDTSMVVMADELKAFMRQKQIKDFKGVRGVRLTIAKDGLHAKVEDETSSFEDVLESDSAVFPEGVEEAHANFSVDALIPLVTALPKGALVTVGFNTESPLDLSVMTETLEARLLLAPLIPED